MPSCLRERKAARQKRKLSQRSGHSAHITAAAPSHSTFNVPIEPMSALTLDDEEEQMLQDELDGDAGSEWSSLHRSASRQSEQHALHLENEHDFEEAHDSSDPSDEDELRRHGGQSHADYPSQALTPEVDSQRMLSALQHEFGKPHEDERFVSPKNAVPDATKA